MGGDRPMTVRRAASLGLVVAALLGIATGLSHIGHTSVSECTGTWRVVVGHASDLASTSTQNARAVSLVPTPCTAATADPKSGYDAYAFFQTENEANAYLTQLVDAGYASQYDFQPYVEQVQPKPLP